MEGSIIPDAYAGPNPSGDKDVDAGRNCPELGESMEGIVIRDPELSRILEQVRQKYPELGGYSLSVGYGPTHHQLGEVNISLIRSSLLMNASKLRTVEHRSADIIVDNSHYHLSNHAKLAVVAHELSHLAALDGDIANDEASITRDSIRRIGANPWRELLRDMCKTPCWDRVHWIGGWRRANNYFVRIVGGIPCISRRGGLFLCPFMETKDILA